MRLLVWILAFIIVAFIATAMILWPEKFKDIWPRRDGMNLTSVGLEHAHNSIDAMRHHGAFSRMALQANDTKTKGILHDTASLYEYAANNPTGFFYDFTRTHRPVPGYVWQLGIYPMVCIDTIDGKPKSRVSVFFIPTMAKKIIHTSSKVGYTWEVLDYDSIMKTKDSMCYKPIVPRSMRSQSLRLFTNCDTCYIYDSGELWP